MSKRSKVNSGPIITSIIVPTYKEVKNMEPLVTRLFKAIDEAADDKMPKGSVEVIVVDDNSRDGTQEQIEKLASEGYNVRIMVRTTERGLSSAVIRGFQEAKGEQLICMDADLQHPPEFVPNLIKAFAREPRPEFILATRYGEGVEMDKDWPLHRQIISWGARLMSRPLTSASDPMSGFFGIRKDVFDRASKTGNLNSAGFKIALELLIKSRVPSSLIAEVPFSFGVRAHGESKLSGKVMIKYIEQLVELYRYQVGDVQLVFLLLVSLYIAWNILYRLAEHVPIVKGLLHSK